MSINTTSTSDRIATDSSTSLPTPTDAQEGAVAARKYPDVSALMSAVPDPAMIAKLANEFFAALPGGGVPEEPPTLSISPQVSPEDTGGHLPSQMGTPDFPRETFSRPAVPNPSVISSAPSPSSGVLSEADFRAIAASLSGATSLVPHSVAASPHGLPTSSPSVETQKGGPWANAPQIPPAGEMYSFPGVPAFPSSPPTSSPSGSDISSASAAPTPAVNDSGGTGRTDPWADEPHFSGLNDVFSFPRVPGASVPGIPQATDSQPSVPASQPILGTVPPTPLAMPQSSASGPESIPVVDKSASFFANPQDSVDLSDAKQAVYPGIATKFPSASEVFSFPGVPGVQSPPGVPVLPSSMPTEIPNEAAGGFSQVPGHSPTFPGSLGHIADAEKTAPPTTSAPGTGESFEFRPDLEPSELGVAKRPLDPRLIRQDFPILQERVHGRQLIWLDNAATTQKPNAVIDRLSYFYRHENSNIHRAAHTLAARATDAYESAREKTRRFLNASSTREIIFVRGTTEGINLIAQAWGRRNVQKDDEVVITWLEHHANIVPWQQLCSEKGARLRVAPVNDRGEIILEEYERLLGPRTKIVSFSQVSNALGTITPAREMVEMAHRHGARVLVDGAQAVSHMRVDVQALDCDFYVFSGHKIFGPTGIGAVYGKLDVLDNMPPWHGGGNMIVDVTFEKTVYHPAPARFEAGTGNIADAVGLGAALDYVEQVGMESISAYEHELMIYATAGLLTVPGLRLIGTAHEKAGVLSFVLDDVRTEDVGAALDQEGIAVRSGHHCAQPILRRMGVESTVRPSLALYNTREEIDALIDALLRLQAGRGHRKS
jgi:cysteine desulfurase/selenocysteine lyase